MPQTAEVDTLLKNIRKSGLIKPRTLEKCLSGIPASAGPEHTLEVLIKTGLLTRFQARMLREGKHKGLLLGPYKILYPLARGGMGIVYVAEHSVLHRRVAIKVCRTERISENGILERFHREGRAAAVLDHPNIIRVHDIGSDGNTHFLVMEYVSGKSLHEILRRRGRLGYREGVGLILQAAQGLQHAHERGLVHRDIKPANLLIDNNGVVKILDMGLARFFDHQDDKLTERLGGKPIIGSPDYIAPEQALGKLDIRSDIYSLGATLYATLSGRPPFADTSMAHKLVAHQSRPIRPLHELDASIPFELSAVVLRMLAKKIEDRYQTPEQVIEALSPWAPGEEDSPVSDSDSSLDTAGVERPARAHRLSGVGQAAAAAAGFARRLLSAAFSTSRATEAMLKVE
jgi:serine/threonine protein kinase